MAGFTDPISMFGIPLWLVVIIFVWSAVWKGLALWRSARKHHTFWFVFFIIINLVGIPEIIYLLVTNKKGKKS